MSRSPSKTSWLLPTLALGLGLSLICLVVVVTRSRSDHARLGAEVAALQARLDAAMARPGPPPVKAENESPAKSELAEAGASVTDAAPPSTAAGQTPESRVPAGGADLAAMMKSPMMQKIMAAQTSTMMQTTYARLMDRLAFTPEEREHFQSLLVEKQTNLQNLGMQLMNAGLAGDERTAITAQLTAAWQTGEDKIREFLNDPADFATYQAYSQQEAERGEIGMFDATLPKEEGLDAATADALANLQYETRKKFPFTVDFYDQKNFGTPGALTSATVRQFLNEQVEFQARVADQAAGVLSPPRLEAFKQNQAAVHQMTTMRLNSIIQFTGAGQ